VEVLVDYLQVMLDIVIVVNLLQLEDMEVLQGVITLKVKQQSLILIPILKCKEEGNGESHLGKIIMQMSLEDLKVEED